LDTCENMLQHCFMIASSSSDRSFCPKTNPAEKVWRSPVGEFARPPWAVLAAVLWAALLVVEAAGQAGASGRLFPEATDSVALRSRLVTIDFAQLASSDVAVAARAGGASAGAPRSVRPAYGELLRLNLFDDTAFTGVVERIEPTFSGGYAISGRLLGVEGGTMMLVVNGDVVAGTIRTLETTYSIRPAGNGLHTVSEVDLSRMPPLGEPILVEPESRRPAVQR
jgi:hypothetical protein